uniref:Nonstructural protein n=1 Tax=Parvoviridae sp. TaxID=1940570 RepID=A0A7D3QIX5_9VIRU|nr:MAG: nonstructural protein [Parvoviridae sp.]
MEGSGPCHRFVLWMGTSGTSGDIPHSQADSLLIVKDFVLSPLPETEKLLKLYNMKTFQCCILQLCDPAGTPYIDSLVYALFFNQLSAVTNWICTGEFNKDGIFHVHAMLQTNARSDSVRRSMETTWRYLCGSDNFTYHFGNTSTFDCLKIQKCHKPESMLGYLMKAPSFVLSNSEQLLQLAYDIDNWNLNAKFKQSEESQISSEANDMTSKILDIIITNGCKTFEDCLKHGAETMSKYLHKPGLQAIVNNCLTFVKSTGGGWSIQMFEKYEPNPSTIHKILLFQGIEPSTFDQAFWLWITKADSKRNTICIEGPSNTGKSAFIAGLKATIPWGEVVNSNTFAFEGLQDCVIGVWEEPLCSPELAEKAKQVLEGMPCSIAVKYKKPQLLPRTPIIITSNHPIWRFCQAEQLMFENRMFRFEFRYNSKDEFYIPRTSELSCKCGYCTASRGRALAFSESSSLGVSSGEQSLHSGQHIWADEGSNVGSGSLLGAGEGTSGCYSGSESSTSELSTHGAESGSRSGSRDEQHMGTFRVISTRDSKCRSSTASKHVESNIDRGSDGTHSSSDGSRPIRKRPLRRGHGECEEEHDSSNSLGSSSSHREAQKSLQISPKRQKLGRALASSRMKYAIEGSDNIQRIPMYVPVKSDWQEYLSYLAFINSPETLDIALDLDG